jgi:hypothetical protein
VDRLKCSLPTCPPGSTTITNSDCWVPHETTRGLLWDGTAQMTSQSDLLGARSTRIEPSGSIRDQRTLADEVSMSDLPPADTGGPRGMQ